MPLAKNNAFTMRTIPQLALASSKCNRGIDFSRLMSYLSFLEPLRRNRMMTCGISRAPLAPWNGEQKRQTSGPSLSTAEQKLWIVSATSAIERRPYLPRIESPLKSALRGSRTRHWHCEVKMTSAPDLAVHPE